MANTSILYRFFLQSSYETLLIEEPKGILDVTSVLERDTTAHGVFFEFTENDIPLEFCGDGRDFLESIYLEDGTDAEVDFIIEKKITVAGEWTEIFRSQIDFNTRSINETYFKCSISKISQFEDLKNRFDTKIDLEATESMEGLALTSIASKKVGLHSKLIKKTTSASGDSTISANSGPYGQSDHTVFIFFGFPDITQSDISEYFTYPLQFDLQTTANVDVDTTKKYILRTTTDGDVTLNATLDFTVLLQDFASTFDYTSSLYYQVNDGTEVQIGSTYSGIGVSSSFISVLETITDLEIDLRLNDTLYFYFRIEITNSTQIALKRHAVSYDITNSIDLVQDSLRQFSVSNLYNIHDAINKAGEIIIGQQNILSSEILGDYDHGYSTKGILSDLYIGNGWSLRNFTDSDKKTKITFKDFFESFNALFALGYGVEITSTVKKLRVEHFLHFYQDNELIDLGTVDDYEEETAEDFIYNQIKLAFKKYANDENEKNTIDDFHTELEAITPIKKTNNKFSKSSSWIMSPYLIEFTRAKQFDENPTESWKYDDDVFLIQTEDLGSLVVSGDFDAYDNTLTVSNSHYNNVLKYSETFDVVGSNYNDGTWTYSRLNVIQSAFTEITINESLVASEVTSCTIGLPGLELRAEKDDAFDGDGSVTGLISPETSYNLRWTLARSLRYWGRWLNSSVHYEDFQQRYKNTFFKNNGALETNLDSDEQAFNSSDRLEIIENDSPKIASIESGAKVFSPDIMKFQTKLTADTINLIIDAHKNNVGNVSYTESDLLAVEDDVLLEVNTGTFLELGSTTTVDSAKNYGYISCRDYNDNKVSGYLMKMRYNIITEIVEFELLKRAEFTDTSTYYKLLESGFVKLLEDGSYKLLENG